MNETRVAGAVACIIPIFNNAAHLAEAVQSAQDQTMRLHEIILVDDGSVDDSARIAHDLARDDGRISLVCVANGGVAAARNIGIRLSTSEFIAPLDADDIWLPEKTRLQCDYLQQHPEAGLVLSASDVFEEGGGVPSGGRSPENQPGRYLGILPSATMFRASTFARAGLFDEQSPSTSQVMFAARAAQIGQPMHTLDVVVQRRRVHAANASHQVRDMQRELLAALRRNLAAARQIPT